MRKLVIKRHPTYHIPFVELVKEKGIFRIYGYSLEEDESVKKCYNDIFDWLGEYVKEPNNSSDFYLGFHYINTYGMKKIFELVSFIKVLPNLRVYYMHDPIDPMP